MDNPFSIKGLLVASVVSIVFFLIIYSTHNSDDKIVFCNIPVGDSIYIRYNNKDILIDAGDRKESIECIGKYMPLFDKNIEAIFLTHPHYDHYSGFEKIIRSYHVDIFFMPPVYNDAASFNNLLDVLYERKVHVKLLVSDADVESYLGFPINIYWPDEEILKRTLNYNDINLDNSFLNLNNASLVFSLRMNHKNFMFTGDAENDVLDNIASSHDLTATKWYLLKSPHHGSRNGLSKTFLNAIDPELVVVTAGPKNTFGHPHKEFLDMLSAGNYTFRITKEEGDIVMSLE